MITLLDGPLGTELSARGVETRLPLWSAAAVDTAPDVVAAIHRDYARAGATVHTTNTFRTKRRTAGDDWLRMVRIAVDLTRQNISPSHRVAGSVSPLEGCYRPDLSPAAGSRAEHREMVEALAGAGCDLLLCETFPSEIEAIVAVEEAVRTGLESWLALTAGPEANLMTPDQMARAARYAVDAGAAAVLVNCTPAIDTIRFVEALQAAKLGVPIGAYANAGRVDDRIGWQAMDEPASRRRGGEHYVEHTRRWVDAGATIIGGCCGTTPDHIAALHRFISKPEKRERGDAK